MLHRRRKRSAHNRPRGHNGQFLKRARAHRRKATHRRRRRHHHRAGNPMRVLMANPHHVAHQRRRRRSRRHHQLRAPSRHRRRRRHLHAPHARRIRRRHGNPMRLRIGSMYALARAGFFGALGIVTARVGGVLYTKYVASHVKDADPKSWRSIASEILRLAAMGALVVGVDSGIKRMVKPMDRTCFLYAGLGEAGRQAIGLAVKQFSPTTDVARYGLDGYSQYAVGQDGASYGYDHLMNKWVKLLDGGAGMQGLVDADDFSGLVDADDFSGDDGDALYQDDGADYLQTATG